MTASVATSGTHDVVIVGDGIVALTLALALARRGVRSLVVGAPRPGAASGAAGGLLAPSIGPSADPAVQRFMLAARDAYPTFVARLAETAGRDIALGPRGILEVAPGEREFQGMMAARGAEAVALDRRVVMEMEPSLAPMAGALFHPADGVVDVAGLLAALGTAVEREPRCELRRADVAGIERHGREWALRVADGSRLSTPTVVLAAGAWTSRLAGLPRAIPVEPVRGQMLPLADAPLSHAVIGPGGYLVPRGGRTIVGSTLERVGYDASTSAPALDKLAALAASLAPALGRARREPGWSGLRPATPDMLPILGPDPEHPGLVYSCGHSKNGILTAPLSGECVAALITGDRPMQDLSPFGAARFAGR